MADEQATNTAEDTPPTSDPASEPTPIDAAKRERDEIYDRLLRMTAEFDNYRKRVDRERREQAERAVVSLIQELLPVVDDFDLAVAQEADAAAYRTGVAMIHAKLLDVLRKQGVTRIDALGADFDPNVHEAVMQEHSADHRDNEVIAEFRKGYKLNDRLLRAAAVKVAKA